MLGDLGNHKVVETRLANTVITPRKRTNVNPERAAPCPALGEVHKCKEV